MLVLYFRAKIHEHIEEITKYNDEALYTLELGSKRVKRGSVRYKAGSAFNCGRCDYAAGTLSSLAKHSRNEHSFSSSPAAPLHSTRNNSLSDTRLPEIQMNENISITDLSSQESSDHKNKALKYTCLSCEYKTKTKSHMDKHVESTHEVTKKDAHFVCGLCEHEFVEKDDYNLHVKEHDKPDSAITVDVKATESEKNKNDLQADLRQDTTSALEEKAGDAKPTEDTEKLNDVEHNCTICEFKAIDLRNLKLHTETYHPDHNEHEEICLKCNKIIRTNSGAQRHAETYCTICEECLPERVAFDIHMKVKHTPLSLIECTRCEKIFESQEELEVHNKTHVTIKCDKCSLNFNTKLDFEWHQDTEHITQLEKHNTFSCEECDEVFITAAYLESHQNSHKEMKRCDQCPFECSEAKDMITHTLSEHKRQGVGSYLCGFCSFESMDKKLVDEHLLEYHQMLVVLNGLANNQKYVSESFDQFRTKVSRLLLDLTDSLVETKQEVFILRQKLGASAQTPPSQPVPLPPTPTPCVFTPSQTPPSGSTPSPAAPSGSVPRVPMPAAPCRATLSSSQSEPDQLRGATTSSTPPCTPRPQSPRYTGPSKHREQQALIIGDAIANNVNIDVLEKALDCKVKTSKAYSAIGEKVGTKVKKPSKYPLKNFKDVVNYEVKNEAIDYLLLQSGSEDISNLYTNDNSTENTTFLKQETKNAARNLFNTAEDALKSP